MNHPHLPPRATFTRLPSSVTRGQHFNALGDALVAAREALLHAETARSPDMDDTLGLWDHLGAALSAATRTANTVSELRLLVELRALVAEVEEAIEGGHTMRDYRLPDESSEALLLASLRRIELRSEAGLA